MKTVAIILGVAAILVVLLVLVNPVLMVITGGTFPKVASKAHVNSTELVAALTLSSSDSPMYVVSLDVPRAAAEQLGLGAPTGFRVEPLKDAKSDPKWVESWNDENLRFAGKLELKPNEATTIRFRLERPPIEEVEIKGQLEAGRTFFNSMTFFYIKVGKV